jgi:LysR family transcriptional regulator, low CO2-responsive transcriptional regulator
MVEKLKAALLRDVTLKQLRVLAAVAKTGKITGAASALGVTPPAVTLQLQQLERSVSLPLFDRSHVGLRPTDAGIYMLDVAERIASTLEECGEGLRQLQGLGRGRVSIGVVSTTKYFAPLALAEFARSHPGVELELLVDNRDEIIATLISFKIDMAIMGRPPETTIELEQQVMGEHPHVIIAPPSHPLAGKRQIVLRSLIHDKFLLRESGSGTRILTDQLFAKAGLAPSFAMEFGSNETIKQAVMAGLGIAFISAHTVAAEVEQGRLAVLRVKGLPLVRKWYVIRAKAKHLLPAGTALWEFLVKDGANFLPDAGPLLARKELSVARLRR